MLAVLLLARVDGQHVGSVVCGKCHPKQYAAQSKSGHAKALSRTQEHPLFRSFQQIPGEWAFGAGDQAVTFVSRIDEEYYLEHGLSYYKRAESLNVTPGHSSKAGVKYRTFDPSAAILRCFQCHTTGPLRLEEGSTIAPFELGVRCESCHGPGSEHAQSQGAITNPGRLNGEEVSELCGACHRKVSEEASTNWTDPWNVRHQPLYFAQSRCFQKSGGKMSCFTCHEPHSAVSRSTAEYSKVCESCHRGVRHRTTGVKQSCTGCHMPMVRLDENLQFANHWIGIYGTAKILRPIR